MNIITKLFVAAWIAAPDFGSGLLATLYWNKKFHRKPRLITYLIGMLAAVLPDIDLPLKMLKGNGATSAHREGVHIPFLIIPIWLFLRCFSEYWANLVATVFVTHGLDDFFVESDAPGLQLFKPLSSKYYSLTGQGLAIKTPQEVAAKLALPFDKAAKRFYLCWPPRPKAVFSLVFPIITLIVIVIDWKRKH